MHELAMKKCIGKPIPEWDAAHRLEIDQSTGPNLQDFGTIFRINSIFMDVIEPSFLEKQWFIFGITISFAAALNGPYIYSYAYLGSDPLSERLITHLMALTFILFSAESPGNSAEDYSTAYATNRSAFIAALTGSMQSDLDDISPSRVKATSYGKPLGRLNRSSAYIVKKHRSASFSTSDTTR